MMVKCPECNADISSEANPCPQCGFPDAGYSSKQTVELRFSMINNNLVGFVERMLNGDIGDVYRCPSLSGSDYHDKHRMIAKSCSMEKDGVGYFVNVELVCKFCGKVSKHHR